MRIPLVLGNWKMNGNGESGAVLLSALLKSDLPFDQVACGVAVPFVYLATLGEKLSGTKIAIGAQDVSNKVEGAFTGEVSASMLKDIGASFTLIGHSERRTYHLESDSQILEKTKQALSVGLKPVVCVGETLAEFEEDKTETVLKQQLSKLCSELSVKEWESVTIAYEPVWAIGTGKVASPEYAQKVHSFIRNMIATVDKTIANQTKILYGGSVKAENAAQLRAMPDIDGALVGGASLVAEQFAGICRNFR
ncbi:triose-phosphate isomerase [Leeia sp. TBRC 13508]|uniref:Triosephosphate isomerase n=1 Tax=Leeia speluncae TaxID=2884804 RepID=A0ABS8D250_9NEIS|nr:triose-phosphate isomerase [Leeia speluncae]MCB6182272.1 triose-phosphate isomerase [Leeia speluncae]